MAKNLALFFITCLSVVVQQALALPLADLSMMVLRKGKTVIDCVERSSERFDDLCLQPPLGRLGVVSAVETCWMDDKPEQLVYTCDKDYCEGKGLLEDQTVPKEATTCSGIPFANLNTTMMGRNYTCRTQTGHLVHRQLNFCSDESDVTTTTATPPPHPSVTPSTHTPPDQHQKHVKLAVTVVVAAVVVVVAVAAVFVAVWLCYRDRSYYYLANSQPVHV